ncbi:SDR family NAD(P)-dependent oxidoreductase [Halorubellus sp. JP-L1]|uniref:SDR family NAD(P)-dependent oxidoreductase n=1 Tax=Halorubellus sp. JP-L1 TaxID=2715753 RepID=UPI0034E96927
MKQTALVTGASAGIGRALARQFARHGHDVVLVARREEALEDAASEFEDRYGVTATAIVHDLDADGAAQALYDDVQDRDLDVGILVNNVGVATYGEFHETDLDAERTQLRLNVETLVVLTRSFLADFRDRGRGKVLNVGSTAGFVPGPKMAGYYASKAYVNSFSEALAVENRTTDVDVSVLCPGPVETEFQERAGMTDSLVGSVFTNDAESVAAAGYRGLLAGDTVILPSLLSKATYYGERITPRPILRRIVERVNGDR